MPQSKPPAQITPPEPHDPYRLRSLEQILSLFDGGEFLQKIMDGHKQLQADLLEHKAEHGTKGCRGSMTIQVSYDLGKSGDVAMAGRVTFTPPKKPPSSAAAYIDEDTGELTLYSPFMRRMHEPPRDVATYDPGSGEIRDLD